MIDRKTAPKIHHAVDFHFELPTCKRNILSNGIPVYWLTAGTQDVVQIEWIFNAGIWEESAPGVAFATASLLKTGTLSKSSEALNEALEFYGASLKSVADNHESSLVLHCLTKHLKKILPIIREILFESAFREEELDIYRKNALNRLAVNLKKVDFVANREGDKLLFGEKHPYGRCSTQESINALSTQKLRDFREEYYNSNNCKIFMAGNVGEEHIAELESYFGLTPWGNSELTEPKHFNAYPANEKKVKLDIQENSLQGAIRLFRPFPTRQHPDFLPMVILNTILGGYFGSRLMTNIREEKGYTYGIYSTIIPSRYASYFLIATEAGKDVCEPAIEEIKKELKRLCEEEITDQELSLVKNYLFGGLLANLDGPFHLIRRWKNIILNDLDDDYFYKSIDVYRNINAKELKNMAQKYFQPDDFYELLVI